MTGKLKANGRFGPVTLTKSGEYENVSSYGPFMATAEFTCEKVSTKGPCTINEGATIEVLNVFGPLLVKGELEVESLSVKGPMDCETLIKLTGNAKILGPLKATEISGPGDILDVKGPVEATTIREIEKIVIYGGGDIEEIDTKEFKMILSTETHINRIKAENVDIRLQDDSGFIKRMFTSNNKGRAEIEEIRATGIVNLENTKVGKVYAKELFIDENSEVGEFIELIDEE